MTIRGRIVLGISAVALLFGLARAPAAFAGDPMTQDVDFKNAMSRGDGVKKDVMARDTRDPMKKDAGPKKNRLPK